MNFGRCTLICILVSGVDLLDRRDSWRKLDLDSHMDLCPYSLRSVKPLSKMSDEAKLGFHRRLPNV